MNRYIFFSILRVGVITLLLVALILSAVDLFSSLDSYISHEVPLSDILYITALYFPSAIILGMGAAFLFSTSYFVAMLHGDNEVICLFNAGISYRKIIMPILILGILVSSFYFVFNETVAIPLLNQKEKMMNLKINNSDADLDNYNVSLTDMDGNGAIFVSYYSDSKKKLTNIKYLIKDDNNNLESYITSNSADWNEEKKVWIFKNAVKRDINNLDLITNTYSSLEVKTLTLEPSLFRNAVTDIDRMSLKNAYHYIKRIYFLDREQYYRASTKFYDRFFGFLTPFILILISCSMNFKLRKNVLFFSILWSISIGIVYYVLQMMTGLMASQGIMAPYFGSLIPFFFMFLYALILNLVFRS